MKKLFGFGLLAGLVAAVVKLVSTQKADWQGLTEGEVRDKLHIKLDSRIPSQKVDQIGDKVVEKMRQRGVLGEEALSEV